MKRRAFDDLTNEPCRVCLELAEGGNIQARAVMPLPKFPARLKTDGRKCCRDCQATETSQRLGNHPTFASARLTVANERCEGLVMPPGMMEYYGMCAMGFLEPCSFSDLESHTLWLESHGIPDSTGTEWFGAAKAAGDDDG